MTDQEKWAATVAWVGVVTGCVIQQDGKYLLVQEKKPKVYGQWNLPAGYVDKGETIEQAAVREVKEESGYDVELDEKVGVYHEEISRPVKHIFRAHIVSGSLQIQPDEILDAKWFSLAEVQRLEADGVLRASFILPAITQVEAQQGL